MFISYPGFLSAEASCKSRRLYEMLIVTKVQWAVAVGAFYLPELLKILLVARNFCQDQSDSRSNRPKQPVKTGNYCRREPINVISKQTNAEDTESAAIKQLVNTSLCQFQSF